MKNISLKLFKNAPELKFILSHIAHAPKTHLFYIYFPTCERFRVLNTLPACREFAIRKALIEIGLIY